MLNQTVKIQARFKSRTGCRGRLNQFQKCFAVMLVSWIGVCIPAYGQSNSSPITVDADRVSVDLENYVRIFEGNVVVVRGTQTVRADRVELVEKESRIELLDAKGSPVEFRSEADGESEGFTAQANRAVVNYLTDKAELSGDVRLVQGSMQMNAPMIFYDLAEGTLVTQGLDGAETESDSRTRVVIDESQ